MTSNNPKKYSTMLEGIDELEDNDKSTQGAHENTGGFEST